MKNEGIIADAVTYQTLLRGCLDQRDHSPILDLLNDSLDNGIRLTKDTYAEGCKVLTASQNAQIQKRIRHTTFVEHSQIQQQNYRGHGTGRVDQSKDTYKKHEYPQKRNNNLNRTYGKDSSSFSWRNQNESTASAATVDKENVQQRANLQKEQECKQKGFNMAAKEFKPKAARVVEEEDDEFVISETFSALNRKQEQKREQRVDTKRHFQNPRKFGRL